MNLFRRLRDHMLQSPVRFPIGQSNDEIGEERTQAYLRYARCRVCPISLLFIHYYWIQKSPVVTPVSMTSRFGGDAAEEKTRSTLRDGILTVLFDKPRSLFTLSRLFCRPLLAHTPHLYTSYPSLPLKKKRNG